MECCDWSLHEIRYKLQLCSEIVLSQAALSLSLCLLPSFIHTNRSWYNWMKIIEHRDESYFLSLIQNGLVYVKGDLQESISAPFLSIWRICSDTFRPFHWVGRVPKYNGLVNRTLSQPSYDAEKTPEVSFSSLNLLPYAAFLFCFLPSVF